MKRFTIAALALFFIFAFTGLSGAQSQGEPSDQATGQKRCPMMMQQEGASAKQMGCAGCPMGGFGMRGKELVATDDGGVVVLMGGRLLKYDKDLNLVKQADVPMDEYMKKMMDVHHPDMKDQEKSSTSEQKKSR